MAGPPSVAGGRWQRRSRRDLVPRGLWLRLWALPRDRRPGALRAQRGVSGAGGSEVVNSCKAALHVLGADASKPPGWECLVKVPELKPLLPEVHDYTRSLSYRSFEEQVERACDWTLQRAAKNTLREALRYVTAEQEASADVRPGGLG
eukprot:Skav229531  [mRNA]  locus=scaffold451:182413:186648:+ [translate_table: standard]